MDDRCLRGESVFDWPTANRPAPLAPGDIHLWLVALDCPAHEIDGYAPLLSADEQARAARFLQPVDRARFIAARGVLRTLLGAYTETAPSAVRFDYNPHGKPELCNDINPHQMEFNLSHSDDWALLAVTRNRAVGVDLERVATDCNFRALFQRFLSPAERADFESLPPAELPEVWFRFWTIKEAWSKAIGTGLTGPLDAVQIPTASAAQWKIETVVPCPGYAAAVATQGEIANLVCRRWAKPQSSKDEEAKSSLLGRF